MSLLKTVAPPAETGPRVTAEDVKRIEALLFARADAKLVPPRRVYAVLDGARDPSIHRRLAEAPGLRECLYRGVTEPDFLAAAPWLVELRAEDEWTRELLLDGWGRSWGIFVEAALPPAALHRHLRTFLKAKAPDDRTLIFRYYDPRVWRVYAPTCNADEARALTGPMFAFACESASGRELLTFERAAEGFAQRTLALEPA